MVFTGVVVFLSMSRLLLTEMAVSKTAAARLQPSESGSHASPHKGAKVSLSDQETHTCSLLHGRFPTSCDSISGRSVFI